MTTLPFSRSAHKFRMIPREHVRDHLSGLAPNGRRATRSSARRAHKSGLAADDILRGRMAGRDAVVPFHIQGRVVATVITPDPRARGDCPKKLPQEKLFRRNELVDSPTYIGNHPSSCICFSLLPPSVFLVCLLGPATQCHYTRPTLAEGVHSNPVTSSVLSQQTSQDTSSIGHRQYGILRSPSPEIIDHLHTAQRAHVCYLPQQGQKVETLHLDCQLCV